MHMTGVMVNVLRLCPGVTDCSSVGRLLTMNCKVSCGGVIII